MPLCLIVLVQKHSKGSIKVHRRSWPQYRPIHVAGTHEETAIFIIIVLSSEERDAKEAMMWAIIN